jgi:hypothetical protein
MHLVLHISDRPENEESGCGLDEQVLVRARTDIRLLAVICRRPTRPMQNYFIFYILILQQQKTSFPFVLNHCFSLFLTSKAT